jgi:hypothetical protein
MQDAVAERGLEDGQWVKEKNGDWESEVVRNVKTPICSDTSGVEET